MDNNVSGLEPSHDSPSISDKYSLLGGNNDPSDSNSLLSSSTLSIDLIDFVCFESENTSTHAQRSSSLSMIAADHEVENVLDGGDITKYPSGRQPLVPLDAGRNKRGKRCKLTIEPVDAGEDTSWITKNLCVVSTGSALDSIDHIIHQIDKTQSTTNAELDESDELPSKSSESVSDLHLDDSQCKYSNTPLNLDDNLLPKCEPDTVDVSEPNQESVSSQISLEMLTSLDDFFGHNSILCNDWRSWYDDAEHLKVGNSPEPRGCDSVSRSCSSNPVTRKKKLINLRQNMAPFDIDEVELSQGSINMNKYSPAECDTIRFSFSNAVSTPSSNMIITKKEKPAHPVKVGECTSLVGSTCGTLGDQGEIELVVSTEEDVLSDEESEILFYDSDPSDLMSPRQCSSHIRRRSNRRKRKIYFPFNLSNLDEATCVEKICEHMNARRLLVWHRRATEASNNPPIAVHAWIEQGSQLESMLIQPKFCWRKNHGKESSGRSILNIPRYHAIDLLDISRIIATDYFIARDQYPFVRKGYSFLIEAYDEELVFEARDQSERDEIVEGLKLLVARLGSKIIMGDGRVLDEFFSPLGAFVPGKVPSVFLD